ncbi:MAG: chain-length determining protein [Candidatus Brevundimonas colombiensis]|uniref:Chain-length determining protein n=1 Tax=Candidatus Brevundimonas colombiensis TaxID=3121376 RepID=A0AAJ6BMQ8_9CAUL|nr:chain-length determining protein [Brevundimonas sp.]WEK40941.1 MAG: chain-length determining protein [Brevundimonas sp.]
MAESKLTYLGPTSQISGLSTRKSWFSRVPIAFLVIVVLPTLITAIYFLLIASPRYVSESSFVVRAPSQPQVSQLGMALQGVGLSAGSTDAYAIHEYVRSADGLRELMTKVDVAAAYDRPGIDPLSRLPRPFASQSFESFRKGFNSFVTIGYDSQTGISTLRVQAFTARDAQRINAALLVSGEGLINRMNARAAADTVAQSQLSVRQAQARLGAAQAALTNFRNREGIIDPARSAVAGSQMISELSVKLATLKAERAQLAADASDSPLVPALDSRIRAFERQIEIEQQKIVGNADSLAPKISVYEELTLEREFADKLLASATAELSTAQVEARRQRLYLDTVVAPDAPDYPKEPRRLWAILTVLTTTLVIYGIGWLVWAGIRESRVEE